MAKGSGLRYPSMCVTLQCVVGLRAVAVDRGSNAEAMQGLCQGRLHGVPTFPSPFPARGEESKRGKMLHKSARVREEIASNAP